MESDARKVHAEAMVHPRSDVARIATTPCATGDASSPWAHAATVAYWEPGAQDAGPAVTYDDPNK